MEQPDVEAETEAIIGGYSTIVPWGLMEREEEELPSVELVKEEPSFSVENCCGAPHIFVKRPFTEGLRAGSDKNWIVGVSPDGSLGLAALYSWVGEETTINLHPVENRIRVFNQEGRELQ